MRLISKTINKVVLETTFQELESKGFDEIWDNIRNVYCEDEYNTQKIHTDSKYKLITITMEKKPILIK